MSFLTLTILRAAAPVVKAIGFALRIADRAWHLALNVAVPVKDSSTSPRVGGSATTPMAGAGAGNREASAGGRHDHAGSRGGGEVVHEVRLEDLRNTIN